MTEQSFMIDLYESGIDTEISLSETDVVIRLIDIKSGNIITQAIDSDIEECFKKVLLGCVKYANIFNASLTGLAN